MIKLAFSLMLRFHLVGIVFTQIIKVVLINEDFLTEQNMSYHMLIFCDNKNKDRKNPVSIRSS